ncbi:MAG: penicillin-binding protein 2, partial [bacterium]|nr:penicillin-binding protein 2 [bacterium]
GIVMDPKTGEVLAMANYPTFDPARAGKAPKEYRRNRILTDPVEPGSVFKPFTMATALAEGVTTPDEKIYCEGGECLFGKRRLRDHHAFSTLTTAQGLIRSSNILMAKLGVRLGNKRLYEALRAFGFGRATGIDLPGEGNGPLRPLDKWDTYSTTSIPMGHEVAVTPIQIVTAFSALVNGGRLLQPRVVRAVIDKYERVIEDHTEVIDRGQVVDPQTAATMREILIMVVSDPRGTGRRCNLDKWQVMGKTGTAQVPRIGSGKSGYEPGAYLGSF